MKDADRQNAGRGIHLQSSQLRPCPRGTQTSAALRLLLSFTLLRLRSGASSASSAQSLLPLQPAGTCLPGGGQSAGCYVNKLSFKEKSSIWHNGLGLSPPFLLKAECVQHPLPAGSIPAQQDHQPHAGAVPQLPWDQWP